MNYKTAEEAFEKLYVLIMSLGQKQKNTLFMPNVGFYIREPLNNQITTSWRKWKSDYAELEWRWYLSHNPRVTMIKQYAKIWDTMHNGDDVVNSNYGYQWSRGKQVSYIIDELKRDPESRRAVITIYDAKEHAKYKLDTPCTLSIGFSIFDGKLNMNVVMRSNDLVYGFCNDQYCFSKLQELIANELEIPIGWYYHFCFNLHIYEKHFKLKPL